jgi:hypothetical protein
MEVFTSKPETNYAIILHYTLKLYSLKWQARIVNKSL